MSTKKTAKSHRGAGKGLRWQDPFLKREQEKYGQPLPSREFILQLVEEAGEPVPMEDLAFRLGLEPEEYDPFRNRLGAMQRDAQLVINRRGLICLPDKIELKAGRVEGHPDGYGFFVPDDRSGDMFISEREMHQVLHGDRVMVRESGTDRRGRKEGKIVEVLQRANVHVVGRFYREHGHQWVRAENPKINQDIVVIAGEEMQAKQGQVVTVEVVEQPTKHSPPMGRIIEVLGNYADPGMEIEIALRKHELPFEFSKATLAQARKLPKGVSQTDLGAGREDVRHLPLVTIDGEDARDFDDAVYCEALGRGGYKLYVAIADVSHYVRPGEPLDRDAYERGTSVYFPRRVIPMLPEELSNGLCSLNPQVDRLCMMCEMEISTAGNIKQYRFYPAVMHSKARLTYNLVWSWLSGEAAPSKEQAWLLPHLQDLYKLFKTLLKARWVRGAIDFETVETKMVFDAQGKIANIVPTTRNDAHRVIEECMLAANVCASDFLQSRKHPALYRVHEGPTPEKLKALREFLAEFGFSLGGGDEPHAKDYAELLNRIKGRPDEQLLQTVMLRSLKQAMYSPDNVGHFGLAYESYTHFTSPIRRYPDLLVHRAIKACLNNEHYQPGNWEAIGLHCSTTERRADEASRDVVNWLKCYYMQDRIGEEYDGVISGVTGFGIFVALNDVFVEGLVHVSDLGQDYFHFDQARHQMLGERTSKRYRLGDAVRIRVIRVDLDSAKIDFTLVQETRAARATEAKPEAAESAPAKAKPKKAAKPAAKAKAPADKKSSAAKKPAAAKPSAAGKKSGKAK
ncbi:RNAse R [Sulfuritortus calidifontis]|uniref:Ribonuclease R n=1 Tax=Sulfuritortus calidifontis TaxID=1914471 RepID=A0A4V2UQF8_9PROT|nr:ribonuclease R [Sulfuritortus calidifontis]TCS70120.1 RNAse R [Sulfuritortus calidifontis]